MKHLLYGGSTAERTIQCPGWIQKSKNIPKRKAGLAALEGSMHHYVQELSRKEDKRPEDYLGVTYNEDPTTEMVFTEEHLDVADIAYNLTETVLDKYDIEEFFVEPFVQWIEDERGGSIDLLCFNEDRTVCILVDYKFGFKKVDPNKAQMPFYAVCALHDKHIKKLTKNVERFIFVIIQPRVEGISEYEMSIPDLRTFEATMHGAIEESKSDKPTVKAGEHCDFCPAQPYCAERRQQIHEATLIDAGNHNSLNAAAGYVEHVESWLKSVKEELFVQMSRGVSIDGWKIVEKRAQRRWDDEGEVMKFAQEHGLLADIQDVKLKSVAQAEKVLKGRDIDLTPFVIKVSSGNTIATEDDRREAVVVNDVTGHLNEMMKQK